MSTRNNIMKRKLRHVPGSPVAGSPVPGSPVPSSPVPSSPVPSSPVPSSPVPSSPVGGHPPAAEQQGSLYSVQDDEPVKVRSSVPDWFLLFHMRVHRRERLKKHEWICLFLCIPHARVSRT